MVNFGVWGFGFGIGSLRVPGLLWGGSKKGPLFVVLVRCFGGVNAFSLYSRLLFGAKLPLLGKSGVSPGLKTLNLNPKP